MSNKSILARRHRDRAPRPIISAQHLIGEHFDEVAQQKEEEAAWEEWDEFFNPSPIFADEFVDTYPSYSTVAAERRQRNYERELDYLYAQDDAYREAENDRHFYDPPLPDPYDERCVDAWANRRFGD